MKSTGECVGLCSELVSARCLSMDEDAVKSTGECVGVCLGLESALCFTLDEDAVKSSGECVGGQCVGVGMRPGTEGGVGVRVQVSL